MHVYTGDVLNPKADVPIDIAVGKFGKEIEAILSIDP